MGRSRLALEVDEDVLGAGHQHLAEVEVAVDADAAAVERAVAEQPEDVEQVVLPREDRLDALGQLVGGLATVALEVAQRGANLGAELLGERLAAELAPRLGTQAAARVGQRAVELGGAGAEVERLEGVRPSTSSTASASSLSLIGSGSNQSATGGGSVPAGCARGSVRPRRGRRTQASSSWATSAVATTEVLDEPLEAAPDLEGGPPEQLGLVGERFFADRSSSPISTSGLWPSSRWRMTFNMAPPTMAPELDCSRRARVMGESFPMASAEGGVVATSMRGMRGP